MQITIIGIDCATQSRKVGLARGRWDGNRPILDEVVAGNTVPDLAQAIVAWLPSQGRTLLAVDAPLGWPAPLGEQLHGHQAGAPLQSTPHAMFRRTTDRVTWKQTGKLPLDVGADRIARTAHMALSLLQAIRKRTQTAVPLAWQPAFNAPLAAIEVYPAGTLAAIGLRSSGYKGTGGTAVRQQLLQALRPHLEMRCDTAPLLQSDDLLDAAICIVAGADFLQGITHRPDDLTLARKEGWIWMRQSKKEESHD